MKTASKDKTERPITAALWRVGESKLPEVWRKKLGLWPGATWFEGAAMGLFLAAVKGNPEAARVILERIVGATPIRIELTGEGGGPMVIADIVKKLFEKMAA